MRWGRTFRAAVISTALSWTTWAVALGTTAEARAEAPAPAQVDAIERLVESYKAKGLSDAVVLVARDGVAILREAYGLANRKGGIGNTPDAEFRIGSITKQFTALAIL